ncbi:hypothetical protein [Lactovum odontotermitis]
MTDSKNDQIEKQEADFERLSDYADSLERKYQPPSEREDDFAKFLSTQKPDFQAIDKVNNESNKSNKSDEQDELEKLSREQSIFARSIDFLGQRKYLLVLIPVFFLLLFLFTGSRMHTGTIKTEVFTYSGQILDDAPNGKGSLTYANGDTYVGSFKAGKFSGSGTFTSKNGGWSFEGSFKNGLADGRGVMTTPDGAKHEETYRNGVLAQ